MQEKYLDINYDGSALQQPRKSTLQYTALSVRWFEARVENDGRMSIIAVMSAADIISIERIQLSPQIEMIHC